MLAEDAAILDLLLAREPRGVELAYDRFVGFAYGLAVALLDETVAQAVVERVYLELWRHPEKALGRPPSLRTYLHTAIVREVAQHLRPRSEAAS